ncbi:MAG: hypothetical protein COB76_06595 [Alphaproteobacteria bacterium]|nr:MAG: hypothetical protein COB76_06595 [Alphaproteobacteria bacterium]
MLHSDMSHNLYHYTRLLPEEKCRIEQEGLAPLSEELIQSKIAILTRYNVSCNHLNFIRNIDERPDNICFVTQKYETIDTSAIEDLTTNWGGEIIRHYIFDCHHLAAQQLLNQESTPFQISVDIRGLNLNIYEGFSSNPMSEMILNSDMEYQIKEKIPSERLTITDISE